MSRRRPLNAGTAPTKRRRRGGSERVTAPPVRPVRPVADTVSEKPAKPRRLAKTLVVLGLAVTVVVLGGQWVLRQPIFRVQHVTLLGVRHEPMAAVLAASGLERHPTMAGVSSGAIERNLSLFAWINGVTVSKHWPNSIVVTVHETAPVAVAFNSRHQLQYVNGSGRDLGPAPLNVNFPTLVYLHPKSAAWPYARAGSGAVLVASELPKAFSAQVSQIIVGASGVVTLKMTTPVTFVLGPPTELRSKFVAIASVIAHSTLKPGDVVDVSVPDELAVTGPAPS